MMGRIELKTVNTLLGYCRDMLLSFDHIKSDEDDEVILWLREWSPPARSGILRPCLSPVSGPITAHGEGKKRFRPDA